VKRDLPGPPNKRDSNWKSFKLCFRRTEKREPEYNKAGDGAVARFVGGEGR